VFITKTVVLTHVKLPGPFITTIFSKSSYAKLFPLRKSSNFGIRVDDSFHLIFQEYSSIIFFSSSKRIKYAGDEIVSTNKFIFRKLLLLKLILYNNPKLEITK
jgi:hypothetical protein